MRGGWEGGGRFVFSLCVVARAAARWISGPARVGVRAGVKGLGGFWVTACSFLGRFRCGFHRDVEGRAVDISCSAKIFGGRTVDFIWIFEASRWVSGDVYGGAALAI